MWNSLNSAPLTLGGGGVVAAGRLSCGILAISCDKGKDTNHVSSEVPCYTAYTSMFLPENMLYLSICCLRH